MLFIASAIFWLTFCWASEQPASEKMNVVDFIPLFGAGGAAVGLFIAALIN